MDFDEYVRYKEQLATPGLLSDAEHRTLQREFVMRLQRRGHLPEHEPRHAERPH